MKRREAREAILQLLFQKDFMGQIDPSDLPTEPYVCEVLEGVSEHQDEIDRLIAERSEAWKLERLYSVDRNLLRMAIYELLFREDVPPEVIINEAVELAKSYGTEKSPSFINGVLDRVLKERVRR
mgnify:CR=1 FL=1